MGSYRRSGKQVLHVEGDTVTHIADAGDNEKAHLLEYVLNNQSDRYIGDASRTLSPSWHGDKVSKAAFLKRINAAIDAANKLDQLKKTLFYGRDNNLITEGLADVSEFPAKMVMPIGANAENVVHAIIGKFTEAGELLEALRNCYNGEPFDRINALEEIGDGFWYDAILLKEMDSNFEDEQRRNIDKLRARFPDAFGPDYANNRDLEAERTILEQPASLAAPLQPTKPVGGAVNVEEATLRSNDAFAAVQGITEAGKQIAGNDELAVGIGGRLQDMPSEKLARQPIRKSDVSKK